MQSTDTQHCPACHGRGVVPHFRDGSPATCPVCEGHGQVPMKYNRRPYDFAFPTQTITGNGTATPSIQLPGDYDFEWWDTVATYTSSSLLVLLEINDIRFMNSLQPGNQNGIPIANWAGTAQLPYSRRFPSRLVKRDTATLYMLDQSGQTNYVSVVLRGFQLIPVSGQASQNVAAEGQGKGT
jgi:hypothetical protein